MMLSISENKRNILIKLLYFLIPVLLFFGTLFILFPLVTSESLGHDEAVYLTKARSWIEGTPADQFAIYRPIGMVAFGWLFLQFDSSEQLVRTFGVIFGAITILFIYLFFKRMFNAWVAISISMVVMMSSLFLQQASHFLNDIPSSGLLIGVLWLLYIYYESGGKSRSIYFVGPFAALAFYLRYGVIVTLGIIVVLSLLILLPQFRKKEGVSYAKLRNSFIVSIFLFAPHFIESLIKMNSLLGILSYSGRAAGRKYLGEGLVDYIQWLPSEIGGWVLGITAVIGIIATTVIIFNKNLRQNYVSLLWIGSIGLLNFITTGLLVHAEARYVFFPMILLSGVGITSIYYLVRNRSKVFANLLTVIFLVVITYSGVHYYHEADVFFKERVNSSDIGYVKVLEFIRDDSSNKNGCALWLALFLPKASWYSQCSILKVSDVDRFNKDFQIHLNKDHYSIVYTKLTETQINEKEAEDFGVVMTEVFRINNLSRGNLIVYRIERKDSDEEEYLRLLEQ